MSELAKSTAAAIQKPPPPNAPHAVAIEGTQRAGRSKVYRHWRMKDGLLKTVDPDVIRTLHW